MASKANDICYSLPRIITMGLQCSFCTYFWEMYTGEFGWTMPEYGVVSSIYSFTQIITFLGFGILFKLVIDQNKNKIQERLNYSKYILMAGTSVHWLTYLLLIILPIRWYGVELAFVGLLFRKIKAFLGIICTPFRLLCNCISFPFILFWNLIRIPLIKFGVYYAEEEPPPVNCSPFTDFKNSKVMNISELPSSPINVGGYPDLEASSALELLLPQSQPLSDSIFTDTSLHPMPRIVSAESLSCLRKFCNLITTGKTTGRNYMTPYEKEEAKLPSRIRADQDLGLISRRNAVINSFINAKQFIFSKKFCIYLLTIAHGFGVSAHELSNKALLTYMYSAIPKIGEALCVNLSFFFISNIFIIVVFSLVKNFSHSKSKFSDTFVIVAIVYMFITAPALYCFNKWTTKKDGSTATTDPKNPWKIVCQCLKWLCLTIWHSTVVFLIFSCGPLINYVAIFIMGGKTRISNFGVLAFLSSLNGTSWLFMIVTKIAQGIGTDTIQLLLLGICIMGQSAVYFLFANCTYLMLIFTGIVNSVFVTYTNIMLDGMVGGNAWKWLFCGGFYSGTNAALAWAMPTMFSAFGQDQTRHAVFMGIKFTYQYCFPTIYRLIAIIFQIASVLSYYIYGIAHYYDKQLDAQAKKRALPKRIQGSAKAFAEAAYQFNEKAQQVNDGPNATHVANFQDAAKHFMEAGTYFKIVGEVLVELVQNANLTRLQQKAAKLQAAADKGKLDESAGFLVKANAITDPTAADGSDPAKDALDTFREAIGIFKGSATKFKDFADAISTDLTKTELVYLANIFKDKAAEFASQATLFHIKAQLISGQTVVSSGIQNKFKTAADKFGKANQGQKAHDAGAANAFYEAIKFLAGQ